VNAEEENTAADLYLFDEEGGKCALTVTPELVEEAPKCLDAGSILYSSHRFAQGVAGPTEQRVLLMKRSTNK
jgi:hypothetical protein